MMPGTAARNETGGSRALWLGLIAPIAAISVAGLGFGHSIPLFSYLLKAYGASDFEIGANTALPALAAVLGAPVYPSLIRRMGLKPFLLTCLALMVLPYLAIHLAGERIAWWYPLRFVFVIGGGGLFAGSEIWINGLAPDRIRGKIIGVYATCLALGFALGPLILGVTGYEGLVPILVGGAVFASAALPLALAPAPEVSPSSEENILVPIRAEKVVFASAAIFAGVEGAMLIFLPVLAIETGLSVAEGARLLTIYGIGLLVTQMPVGQLADMKPPRLVMAWCAGLSGLLLLLLPLTEGSVWLLSGLLFFWGGAVGGIYTAGLVTLGNRFKGEALAAANTGFVFTYAVGGVIGPLLAGGLRDLFGPMGLTAGLVAVLLAYALAALRPASR
ncbi:MFS transporter [Parvularcula maris]|uniref:MFS transporter n=1 Tax=Parvularcula maris TaxID=2965077 RepID=A0A9X2RIK1_9PROT|nr:MFS transporter [Parvularcula maris]MCQ8186150.1 MFS transporter [Parvularcula maris]